MGFYTLRHQTPSSSVLVALAKNLGVSIDFLMSDQVQALEGVEFRTLSSTSAKDRARVEAEVMDQVDRYLTVEELLELDTAHWTPPIETARLKSLADSWADTTTPTGRLILTVLGGLAEFERSLIMERTSEGRERARREGHRLGRPPKLTAHQRALVAQWRADGQDNAQIARALGVSRSTVSRV